MIKNIFDLEKYRIKLALCKLAKDPLAKYHVV
jgi:hypothetical protein